MRDSDVISFLSALDLQIEGSRNSLVRLLGSPDCPIPINDAGVTVLSLLRLALDTIANMRIALVHTNVPRITDP